MDAKSITNTYTNIFVWGGGARGISILKTLKIQGIPVVAFIDNDYDRVGNTIEEVTVVSPNDFFDEYNLPTTLVIISPIAYSNEIVNQINSIGFLGTLWTNYQFHLEIEGPYLLERVNTGVNTGKEMDTDYRQEVLSWFDNIMSEVAFWKKEAVDSNGNYHAHYLDRVKEKPFVCPRLHTELKNGDKVLDVGCGICSQYGNILPEGRIELLGVDPLAYFYNWLNFSAGYANEVKFGLFEILSRQFERESADVILIDNALDHCIDPYSALIECLKVVKVGGTVSTAHHIDEAFKAGYAGLHHWNIGLNYKQDFIIWNEQTIINISDKLKDYCRVETSIVPSPHSSAPFGLVICNITPYKAVCDSNDDILNDRIKTLIDAAMREMANPDYVKSFIQMAI